jgi:glycosyltransferase involved in cell wall biosynthesis
LAHGAATEVDGPLDIIIPAHNEADRIGPTLTAYRRGFTHPDVRFIVALDDCRDATEEIVRLHAEADERVELATFPKLGKGGVIREAFKRCQADLVAFVDADGSTSPEQLLLLVGAVNGADGAIASRRLPASSVHGDRARSRTVASVLFAWLVRLLFGLRYRDTQCGAKIIRREALQCLLARITTTDFLFDVDLLLQADELNYRVVEVPTIWVARSGSKVRMLGDLGNVAGSLLRLWMDQRRRWPQQDYVMPGHLYRGRHAA